MGNSTLKYILFILICSIKLLATEVQQLENKLRTVYGNEKVDLLINLSWTHQTSNPHYSLTLSNEAYHLAKATKDEALVHKALFTLAKSKFHYGKFDEALVDLESCLNYAKKTNNFYFEIDLYVAKGEVFQRQNNNMEAKNCFAKSLILSQRIKEITRTIIALNNLGYVYESLNDLGNAVDCYLSSLKLNQNKMDSLKLVETYIKLTHFYLKLGNKKQAKEFLDNAKLYCNNKMENELGLINNYLSEVYYPEDRVKTLFYLQEALKFKDKIKDKREVAEILSSIGVLYREQKQFSLAEKYFTEAVLIYENNNDTHGVAVINLNFVALYYSNNQLSKAEKYLLRARDYIRKSNNIGLKIELAEKSAFYYISKGDFKNANKSREKHILLLDTLAFVSKNQRFNSIYTQFKDEETKQQIELFKRNQDIQDLKLSQNKTQIALLIVATILLMVIIGVFSRRASSKKKKELEVMAHNEQLAKLTDELKLKNEDLEVLKADLEDSLQLQTEINDTNKKLVTIIAHEYKTPMNYIQNALDLFVKTARKENLENAESHIDNTIGMISKITNLLDQSIKISKSNSSKLNLEIEELQINKYFNELIFDYFIEIDTQNHQFKLTILDEEKNIFITPSVLDLIFHNLILNAVKYSPPNSQIDITLNQNGSYLLVSVKDNGIGIPIAEQSNLFLQNHRFSNVEDIEGSGFGLHLAKQILDEIKGSIEIISDTNIGTLINLMIPLDTRS